jgi:hypothetical protein
MDKRPTAAKPVTISTVTVSRILQVCYNNVPSCADIQYQASRTGSCDVSDEQCYRFRVAYRRASIEVAQVENGVTAELELFAVWQSNAYGMNPPWNVALASQQRTYTMKDTLTSSSE